MWRWQTEHTPTNETTFKKWKLQHKVERVTRLSHWHRFYFYVSHMHDFKDWLCAWINCAIFHDSILFRHFTHYLMIFDCSVCYRLDSRNDPNIRVGNWFAKYAFSDKNGFFGNGSVYAMNENSKVQKKIAAFVDFVDVLFWLECLIQISRIRTQFSNKTSADSVTLRCAYKVRAWCITSWPNCSVQFHRFFTR